MFSEEFLQILRCPINHGRLQLADGNLLAQLNEAIASGQVQNRAGGQVEQALEGGLVDATGALLYPVHGGVPCLLAEEAIVVSQLDRIVKD